MPNRCRVTDAEFKRARRGAGFSTLFALRPPQIVILGFRLVGLLLIAAREFAPHNWPGACYDAQFESRGDRPGLIQVCLKHVPFAEASSVARPVEVRHGALVLRQLRAYINYAMAFLPDEAQLLSDPTRICCAPG